MGSDGMIDERSAQPRGDRPQTLCIPLVGSEAQSRVPAAPPSRHLLLPAEWEIKRPV